MGRRPVVQEAVLAYLSDHPEIEGQDPLALIAEAIGKDRRSVHNAASELVDKGQVSFTKAERNRICKVTLVEVEDPPEANEALREVARRRHPTGLETETPLAPESWQEVRPEHFDTLARALLAEATRVVQSVDQTEEVAVLRNELATLRSRHASEAHLRRQIESLDAQLNVEREKARTANARCEVLEDRLNRLAAAVNDDKRNYRPTGSRPAQARSGAVSRLSPEEQALAEFLRSR